MGVISILQPRDYQVPVISAVCTSLAKNRRALMCMATGTGKTMTSGFSVRKLFKSGKLKKNDRVLFICHNTEILDHAENEYRKIFAKTTFGTLTGNEKTALDAQFIFATFQTMANFLETFGPRAFALIVVDEGHHSYARTYKAVLDHFTPRLRLGMTATPDRMDGGDIRDIFGPEVANLTLVNAIKLGCVTPVKYHLLSLDIASGSIREIKRELDEGKRITRAELDRRLFNESHDEDIAKTINDCKGKKIIFCKNIEQAERFVEFLDDAVAYHSKLTRALCRQLFDQFAKGKIKSMLVVDAFNEGIDIPDADYVIFLRATESKTIFFQQLGRGLRLAKGKTKVTVLDFVANIERIQLLQGLAHEIRELNEKKRDRKPKADPTDEFFGTDCEFINFDVHEEIVDLIEVLERVNIELYPTMREASIAAQYLGLTSQKAYQIGYRVDPRLPSNPNEYYKHEWISWGYFLLNEPEKYKTYNETRIAARRLGIQTKVEFARRYNEDPRLPSNPQVIFKNTGWISWKAFLHDGLEQGKYSTYSEAKRAANRLKAKNKDDYSRLRPKDPRLPSHPNELYKDRGWISWPAFLNRGSHFAKIKDPYPTLQEAKDAVKRLGIIFQEEYRQRYREDPRLPSNPNNTYKDKGWISWTDFFGKLPKNFYPTLKEAMSVIRRHGVQKRREFIALLPKDPRLSPRPESFYRNKGWISYPHFLGKVKA